MRAITTQEEIARFATKWSHKKSYQGIDQIMLNLLPLDKQNKPKTDAMYQIGSTSYKKRQEVHKNNSIKGIQGPLFCRLGKEKAIPAKKLGNG